MSEIGAPEFRDFLAEQGNRVPPAQVERPSGFGEVVEASNGSDDVSVRLRGTDDVVVAERAGFPRGWHFEAGDLVSVELRDGGWKTMPEMAAVEEKGETVTYWVQNEHTGRRRRLTEVTREIGN